MAQFSSALISVADCLRHMQQHAAQRSTYLNTHNISLNQALNAVLAQSIVSTVAVPPLDNSAMDGYACRAEDVQLGQTYAVVGVCYAGQAPQPLLAGQVVRIFTGAPIPVGADSVIMQENVSPASPDHPDHIVVQQLPKQGENIRRAGQDIEQGQTVLPAGTRLGAAEIGLLASIGVDQLTVYRPLRVSVLATGDELVPVGQPLQLGQIYNSNTPLLLSLLQQLGCEISTIAQVPDQPNLLQEKLLEAAEVSDLIITTGGASVGDADHLKPVLQEIGAIEQWKVAIKPGKPLVWGHVGSAEFGTPLLGLPGNPQSVWVTFLVLALPYIKRYQGQTEQLQPISIPVAAGFSRSKSQNRTEYLRVRLQDGRLVPHANQSSGVLSSAVWADGFAVIETGQTLEVGELVQFLPFSGLLDG